MNRHLLYLSILVSSLSLPGQEVWQQLPVSNHGQAVTAIKAIGVTGNCQIGEIQHKASFVIWGNKEGKELIFSLIVEPGVIPKSIIEKYHGPDLSDEISKNRSLEIIINRSSGSDKIKVGVVVSSAKLFPDSIRLNNREMLTSGISLSPEENARWMAFQHKLRQPFKNGVITFTDKDLGGSIVFSFESMGFETLFQEFERFMPYWK